jgi:hypothetical protein
MQPAGTSKLSSASVLGKRGSSALGQGGGAAKTRKTSHPAPVVNAATPATNAGSGAVVQHGELEFWRGDAEAKYEQQGHKALQSARKGTYLDRKTFAAHYRFQAIMQKFGGAGWDENISTSLTKEHVAELLAAGVQGLDVGRELGLLSMMRTPTDALGWHTEDEKRVGAHPGGLRKEPNTNRGVVHEHGRRDKARREAVKAEFKAIVPKLKGASVDKVQVGHAHMMVRSQVETINRFSQPWETFQALGPSDEKAFHAKFGDITKKENFAKMAAYMHETRENMKWRVAWEVQSNAELSKLIPQEMKDYTKGAQSPEQARQSFLQAVQAGQESRINTASRSRASTLATTETLRQAAASSAGKRAVSPPRQRPG